MPFLTQSEIRSMFTEPDGIDRERYIVVHYVMKPEAGLDISTAAAELALVTSIGTVVSLPFETAQRRNESLPKIVLTRRPVRRWRHNQSDSRAHTLPC
jgi:ribulose 1,5-bisphosphate carboxylase large subunit-like protein